MIDITKITYSMYIRRDTFKKKFRSIYDVNLDKFVFIHTSEITTYILIEYNENDINRLMKLYKVTKSERLKELYDFITFCKENELKLDMTNGL